MRTTRESRDLVEAKERAQRARDYAEMHPEFIGPDDLIFQNEEWQLEQLAKFKERSCPAK